MIHPATGNFFRIRENCLYPINTVRIGCPPDSCASQHAVHFQENEIGIWSVRYESKSELVCSCATLGMFPDFYSFNQCAERRAGAIAIWRSGNGSAGAIPDAKHIAAQHESGSGNGHACSGYSGPGARDSRPSTRNGGAESGQHNAANESQCSNPRNHSHKSHTRNNSDESNARNGTDKSNAADDSEPKHSAD